MKVPHLLRYRFFWVLKGDLGKINSLGIAPSEGLSKRSDRSLRGSRIDFFALPIDCDLLIAVDEIVLEVDR
jgi:hypothetical protein